MVIGQTLPLQLVTRLCDSKQPIDTRLQALNAGSQPHALDHGFSNIRHTFGLTLQCSTEIPAHALTIAFVTVTQIDDRVRMVTHLDRPSMRCYRFFKRAET